MEAYLLDWLSILVRWLHFITGVAWIGSSLYFIWLDNHLEAPRDSAAADKGVGGELWSVHGGGFYHAQKYKVAPQKLPQTLHWFKWEAYSTWLSGMFLLGLIYFLGAEIYLVDRAVADLSAVAAIGIAIAFIAGGWVAYDLMCRSPLANNDRAFACMLLLATAALAWGLCQLFGGRAAYILFGVTLGTIMVGNVFFVIIPGQKKMVSAAESGAAPDPADGQRAKLRSVHNTYFTLPVLFVMTSNHYAVTYSHEFNWAILIGISLAGALIRIWFVARHKGSASPLPVVAAVMLLAMIAALVAPRTQPGGATTATMSQARNVINARCLSCHSSAPVHPAFPAAPLGVMFDNDEQILAAAERIYVQSVVTRVMPIGNLTAMTNEERQIIEQWYQSLGGGQ
ncbi:MAG: urate hydroxylase PuuD [Gammaproteobacteria bacterium]|nr:urate hydroxylase PuuD [Gammaproteobacteria bacterium]